MYFILRMEFVQKLKQQFIVQNVVKLFILHNVNVSISSEVNDMVNMKVEVQQEHEDDKTIPEHKFETVKKLITEQIKHPYKFKSNRTIIIIDDKDIEELKKEKELLYDNVCIIYSHE
jgi:beta-N-acetylglucosaminidase